MSKKSKNRFFSMLLGMFCLLVGALMIVPLTSFAYVMFAWQDVADVPPETAAVEYIPRAAQQGLPNAPTAAVRVENQNGQLFLDGEDPAAVAQTRRMLNRVSGRASIAGFSNRGRTQAFVDKILALKPAAVKGTYVKSVHLSATMSPSVKMTV